MRQRISSALVQVVACRRFGVKPFPAPMLTYCEMDPHERTSVKFEFMKTQLKRGLQHGGHFVQDEVS